MPHSVEVSPLPNTLYRGAFEMLVLPRLLPENIYKQDFLAKRGGPYGDDPDHKLGKAMLYFRTSDAALRAASALDGLEVELQGVVDWQLAAESIGEFEP